MTLAQALQTLMARKDLSRGQARGLLNRVFAGEASDAQVAGLLVALAMKGETVEEIVGFAEAMRAAVTDIGLGLRGEGFACVDTCGTGGNERRTFNVSTAAAFVAAGAGQPVAKHGNRTSTSVSGSADVLERAGVNLEFPPERLGSCLRATGIVFLYAPLLHGAMKQVMPARRALQVRTIFNLLGPLTNPAGAGAQVVGVPATALIPTMANALLRLGTRHSFVVRSQDGLGELSTTALTDVAEVVEGQVHTYTIDAQTLGLPRARVDDLACASAEEAVKQLQSVLAGEPGPKRDVVCLNAAAALVAGGKATDLGEGLEMARESIDTGAARSKLEALAAFTQKKWAQGESG